MYLRKIIFVSIFFFTLLFSCKDPVSPIIQNESEEALFKRDQGTSLVKVLTRNVYVGADVDKIMQTEDPNLIPVVVTEVFQSLMATNFPERAEALAKEIFEKQPHLIGLQEVSLIRMQSPGDAAYGGATPADSVALDYLQILLMTMNGMGLEYEVVAKIENVDVEMPMVTSEEPTFDDVRLTDYDVILAKKGISITNVEEINYRAKVIIPEMGIEIPRGYTAVTAKIKNQNYRFVNTHLEDADQGGELLKIQMAQATELLLRLARVKIPVILVGDFNSAAHDEPTYRLITLRKRFKDTWLMNEQVNNLDGYTYGHDLDLLNPTQNFWKRIDYIFVRNGWRKYKNMKLKKVSAEVVGDEIGDKTDSGLWPSDHGGVAAELEFKSYEKNKRKWIKKNKSNN